MRNDTDRFMTFGFGRRSGVWLEWAYYIVRCEHFGRDMMIRTIHHVL
jgi:hypothetical protein